MPTKGITFNNLHKLNKYIHKIGDGMNQPQIGDIIFVHGRGILSRLIEFFDKGRFSHVCVQMPHDSVLESQYFKNTRIIDNIYRDKKITTLPLNLTEEQKHKLVEVSFNYLEDKYDLKQIFGLLFHYLLNLRTNETWNNPNELICSELVVDVLFDIGYLTTDEYKQLRNCTPNILYDFLNNKINKNKTA